MDQTLTKRWLQPARLLGLLPAAALILLALFEIEGTAIRLIIVFSLIHQALLFGKCQAPLEHPVVKFVLGAAFFLAIQSLAQAAWYYGGGSLGWLSDALSAAFATLAITFIPARSVKPEDETGKIPISRLWSVSTILIALFAGAYILLGAYRASTELAIRTPWPLLPPGTLLAFGLIIGSGLLAAWQTKRAWITALISGIGIFSLSAIPALVYRLGYGFDGFLHRASQNIILQTGTLEPKPLYYIGQYVLTTWLSRFWDLPLNAIDVWLVPSASIFLALAAYLALRGRASSLVGLSLLAPLAAFVTTTPQSFAYILGFTALGLAIAAQEGRLGAWLPIILGAWALIVHPLAGLPFLLITAAVLVIRLPYLSWPLVGASALSVPFAFLATGLNRQSEINWTSFVSTFLPNANHAALWPDWASLVIFFIPIALLALSIVAILRDAERRQLWLALLSGSVTLIVAGCILKAAGDFAFLIDYERGNYADRLFIVAALFALLPAMRGLGAVLRPSILLAIALMAWGSANVYAALPRHDAAATSRGWSVSLADFEAVRWIEQDANNQAYTVLANQSVSAAAVQSFGFKRYVKSPEGEDVFYYPIPTGGELYQLYLQAVGKETDIQSIREAARLGQSNLVYVVLNEYWWDAERVGENLSAIANAEQTISNGRARVFRFEFTEDSR